MNISVSCNASYFKCADSTSLCIPWTWVCDNDTECYDGSDESQTICKNSGKCGGNFNASNGLLTSPSYPDIYSSNSECIYIISQPTNTFVNVTIRIFSLYDGKGYLEIRDGNSEESPLIGVYAGDISPTTIQSTQNHTWLK